MWVRQVSIVPRNRNLDFCISNRQVVLVYNIWASKLDLITLLWDFLPEENFIT